MYLNIFSVCSQWTFKSKQNKKQKYTNFWKKNNNNGLYHLHKAHLVFATITTTIQHNQHKFPFTFIYI